MGWRIVIQKRIPFRWYIFCIECSQLLFIMELQDWERYCQWLRNNRRKCWRGVPPDPNVTKILKGNKFVKNSLKVIEHEKYFENELKNDNENKKSFLSKMTSKMFRESHSNVSSGWKDCRKLFLLRQIFFYLSSEFQVFTWKLMFLEMFYRTSLRRQATVLKQC